MHIIRKIFDWLCKKQVCKWKLFTKKRFRYFEFRSIMHHNFFMLSLRIRVTFLLDKTSYFSIVRSCFFSFKKSNTNESISSFCIFYNLWLNKFFKLWQICFDLSSYCFCWIGSLFHNSSSIKICCIILWGFWMYNFRNFFNLFRRMLWRKYVYFNTFVSFRNIFLNVGVFIRSLFCYST